MATAFARVFATANRVFDSTYGARFRLIGRVTPPNGRAGPDPDRPDPVDVTAIPETVPTEDDRAGGITLLPGRQSAVMAVSIVATSLPWRPREGDRADCLSDGRGWKVSRVAPWDNGRVLLILIAEATP